MKIIRGIIIAVVFILLTLLTQVGGVIYLASFPLFNIIHKKAGKKAVGFLIKATTFLGIYSFATFCIVPLIVLPFGRVPLPVIAKGYLRPLNFITCLLNRHYVRVPLKQIALMKVQCFNLICDAAIGSISQKILKHVKKYNKFKFSSTYIISVLDDQLA